MFSKTALLLFITLILGVLSCSCSSDASAFSGGSGDADGDTDADSDADSDSDADTDADSDGDTDADSDADSDSDADADAGTDGDGGTDGDTDSDTGGDADGGEASCDGAVVGEACWYLGAEDGSCEDTCAAHGGFDVATQYYAGSDGTDAHCTEVLEALGATGGTVLPLYDSGTGVGCVTYFGLRYRISDAATTADATYAGAQRACACNQ